MINISQTIPTITGQGDTCSLSGVTYRELNDGFGWWQAVSDCNFNFVFEVNSGDITDHLHFCFRYGVQGDTGSGYLSLYYYSYESNVSNSRVYITQNGSTLASYAPNMILSYRLYIRIVALDSQIFARIWRVGNSEPSGWHLQATTTYHQNSASWIGINADAGFGSGLGIRAFNFNSHGPITNIIKTRAAGSNIQLATTNVVSPLKVGSTYLDLVPTNFLIPSAVSPVRVRTSAGTMAIRKVI